MDDIIIGGKDKVEHLEALEAVFKRLYQNGLQLRSNKCVFFVKEVQYLSYVLCREGIKTDPKKIEAVAKIPRPNNSTELRSFLGLVNFYAQFMKHMSAKLVPLYNLLKKESAWSWARGCEKAVMEVKKLLINEDINTL